MVTFIINLFSAVLSIHVYFLLSFLIVYLDSTYICQNDFVCKCNNISNNEITIQCENGRFFRLHFDKNNVSSVFVILDNIAEPLRKYDFKNYTQITRLRIASEQSGSINVGSTNQDLIKGKLKF